MIHVVAMVTWFAALFYLPRLFVYHAQATDTHLIATLKIMERRLYRAIANPSIALVFLAGIALLWLNPALLQSGWMHIKLTLVLTLLVYHIACGRLLRRFAVDENRQSSIFFRWFNEYPTLILVAVVILVIFRPTF